MSNKIDLKLFSLDKDGNVTFSFRNLGERALGVDKLVQKYLRFFYGEDCGAILKMYRDGGLSPQTISLFRNGIISAIIKTNEKIKILQSGDDLHDDETFVDCELKKLDIDVQSGQVNLTLNLVSKSGAVIVST